MKKNLKAVLALLFAAVLAFNFVPSRALAVENNEAFLAFADAAWGACWWGTGDAGNGAGVTGTDVVVDGAGTYTVGVDFTGTENGYVDGLAFTAPMIQGGNKTFEGYIIQIDSIQINGEDIPFTESYTSCDADGKDQLRSNVYNSWVTALPEDARTADGTLDGASACIVDPALFVGMKTVTLTFTLIDPNAPAVEETAAEDTATDDAAATTDVPKTGVVDLGIVYGLGAIATGAFALRRKQR